MKYLILIFSLISLSSCKYNITYGQFKNLATSKLDVERVSREELTEANQKVLREYFSNVKDVAYQYMSNKWMKKYVHNNFFRYYNDSFCSDLIVSEKSYQDIMKKCNVSGFYICSEEVRSYKEILLTIKKSLWTKEIDRINSDVTCREKLELLNL